MQLKITFRNQEVLDFPVNYNYYIQSAIFSLLAEESSEYAGELHNVAFGGIAKFKMFTFSPLIGKCHFHNKILSFEGDITLEIRSASDTFMQVLANSLLKVGEMRIGRHTLYITRVEGCDYQIENSVINIKTIAPIVCKVTTDDKKTIYFSPNEVMFIKLIRENFEKKYQAFYDEKPDTSIDILPIEGGKKIVSKYKGLWITAYHGLYQVGGDPMYLQFLYNVGLGSKTSQGFGLFNVE